MTYATNEFNETRKLFIESIGYEQPLTYDLWMDIPADLKSAALFLGTRRSHSTQKMLMVYLQ